jgi:hypothetical protein
MPSGGWFVLLFKQCALPIFALYGASRFSVTHICANSAETISRMIEQGSVQFTSDIDESTS